MTLTLRQLGLDETSKVLKEAVNEGIITCRNCGNQFEPDGRMCYCGWVNPLLTHGYI